MGSRVVAPDAPLDPPLLVHVSFENFEGGVIRQVFMMWKEA
jgi:hypothetical protein